MDSNNDTATAIITYIRELLTEASNITWSLDKTGAIWRLAPAAARSLAPSAYQRLHISPVEEGTSEALEICVVDYDLPGDFLLYLARTVYEEFGFLTEWEPDSPAANPDPIQEEEEHSRKTAEHPAGPVEKGAIPRNLPQWSRRSFLITPALGAMTPLRAAAYKAAVAYGSDPYVTATRAITASNEFPNVSGKTVIIKTNLVVALPSSTGCTSDPQVVRAVVDLALARGATQVIIAESPGLAGGNVPFAACDYESLVQSRVSLLDFAQSPVASVPVNGGYVYRSMLLPALAADPSTVWMSVAKMKVHALTGVTLGLKNSFGLFLSNIYGIPPVSGYLPRVDPHFRGLDQSIVDTHIARPMDFTVIDGIIGMEWTGPTTECRRTPGALSRVETLWPATGLP